MTVVYAYKNCDTCRKALKWLKEHDIPHETRAIRETPPTTAELETALQAAGGDLRRLFNTSGGDYRELGLKDTLPSMGREEALKLLSTNGNLVKRPLLLGNGVALIGFNEAAWEGSLGQMDK